MERLTKWKYGKKLLAKTKFSGDFGSARKPKPSRS